VVSVLRAKGSSRLANDDGSTQTTVGIASSDEGQDVAISCNCIFLCLDGRGLRRELSRTNKVRV
jgi:hypothetical protein